MPHDAEILIIKGVVSKLDTSLDKITEVSHNISRLLAVQDERISNLEKTTSRHETDSRDLQYQMTNISREISQQFNDMNTQIDGKLREFANDIRRDQKDLADELKEIEDRLETLERYRWIIVGGAAVVGYVVSQLKPIIQMLQ